MSKWRGGVIRSTQITPGGSDETAAASGVWRASDAAYWVRQGQWPTPAPVDPYFPYNTLFLRDSGINDAQNNVFLDSSSIYRPITRTGNTTQGKMSPYGSDWSNYFDGNGDYLTVPSDTALTFGTGDLTVEAWIYMTTSSNDEITLFGIDTNTAPLFGVYQQKLYLGARNTAYDVTASVNIPLFQWVHVAVTRQSNAVTLWQNGVSVGSGTVTRNYPAGTGFVGTYTSSGAPFYQGFISNLRVIKGTAIYTSTFTPPTQPLTAISGTSLLACQSNRFRDASSNNFAITRNGDVRVAGKSPFSFTPTITYGPNDITSWSHYFGGSGNYLTLSDASQFNLSGGAYTIECWINPAGDYGNYNTIVAKRVLSSSSTAWEVYLRTSTGVLSFYNGTNYESTVTPTPNVWSHVAAVYDGTNINLYLNGTRVLQSAMTNSNVSAGVQVGTFTSYDERYIGHLSNLRITKGAALYTGASFTVPTSPLTTTVSSGTVSLLMCNNPAVVDSSTNAAAITTTGSVPVTGFSPFATTGYYSTYFDGTGDNLSISNFSSALSLGSGDFTIEMWVYPTTAPNNNWSPFFTMGNSGGGQEIRLSQNINGTGWGWLYPNNSNNADVYVGYGTLPINRWHHIAMTRSGSNVYLFLNGTQVATASGISFNHTNTTLFRLGMPQPAYSDGTYTGNISNFRIVKGTALYTSAFTPSTSPLTAVSGTGILTCQNSLFKDNSTNSLTLTSNGNPYASAFNPFFSSTPASGNGGSMYFDGTTDYLNAGSSPYYAFGTGDFTIECWFYQTAAGSTNQMLMSTDATGGFFLGWDSSNFTFGVRNTAGLLVTNPGNITNVWNHVAVVRSSGTLSMFLNGTRIGTGSNSTNFNITGPLIIGGLPAASSYYWNGYITGVKIDNGQALYNASSSTITVPTTPKTATGTTTLLVNGTNAAIYDHAGVNNLETGGDVRVNTTIKKYGSSSIYFDGSDFLYAPSKPENYFGTGNFTIEGWFYFLNAATNVDNGMFGNYLTGWGTNTIYWGKHTTYGGKVALWVSSYSTGGAMLADPNLPPANTWVHYAVVRNGNTWTMYRDGTSVATQTYSGDPMSTKGDYVIGRADATAQYFYGYMDEFRISKYARYTSNFTPPTTALPLR